MLRPVLWLALWLVLSLVLWLAPVGIHSTCVLWMPTSGRGRSGCGDLGRVPRRHGDPERGYAEARSASAGRAARAARVRCIFAGHHTRSSSS